VESTLIFIFGASRFPRMLVCHCRGVTEREVRSAIRAGACTHREVARTCGAGSICGGCRPVIDELLERHDAPSPAAVGFELATAG